jgi:hypothetical protein
MSYDNTNEGVLFNAMDKKSKETDRDYSGNLEVKCPHCNANSEHWLSAWINESAAGKKYMKIKMNAKDAAPAKPSREPHPAEKHPITGDDIPF